MKIKLLAALAALGMSGNALAYGNCAIVDPLGYQVETLLIKPTGIIKLRADAEVSPVKDIGRAESDPTALPVKWQCDGDRIMLSRPLSGDLVPYRGYPGMYETNITGIGVKFFITAPGGSTGGLMPIAPYKAAGNEDGATYTNLIINRGRIVAYFYKLENNVSLSTRSPDQNLILDPVIIGHTKIENLDAVIYKMESVFITGIPVCKVDAPLPVDFNTVNAADVRKGVEKTFEFGINCATDYGNYDIAASIEAINVTNDGLIPVDDYKLNNESLTIEISEFGSNKKITADGKTKLYLNDIKSGVKANFKWQAKLKKQADKPYPAQGPFRASAIITLEIK